MASLTCIGFLVVFQCDLPPPPPPVVVCPPMPAWSKAYQSKLADEAEALSPNSAIASQLREHIQLRDRIRRCRDTQSIPTQRKR